MPTNNRRHVRAEWKRWNSAQGKLCALIRKLEREISPHGQKWTDNMVTHYERRLADLETREPPKHVER